MVIGLAGCVALHRAPQERPVSPGPPAAWTHADRWPVSATAAADEAWWSGFGDPLLARLVNESMQANVGVLGAQAALRQARALRSVAAGALQPRVDGSGSASRSRQGGANAGNLFQVGLDASWEIDVFGARRAAVDTAEAAAGVGVATLGELRVSIAAEVGLAYIALRGSQTRLAVGEDNLRSQAETAQLTTWRAQAGLLSALEAEQARAASAQTAAALPPLRATVALQAHALAVLTGRPADGLDTLLADARPVPWPGAALALRLPADTLRQRPDVRAAEQQVLAAQGRVGQADAARYPGFRLGGSLGLSALTLAALRGSGALTSSLLAGIAWPAWDGGAARAQVAAQQAALDQARWTYRGTVLTALKEVEDALVALQGDLARLERLTEAAGAATLAATYARQRHLSGLVDFQTVLETQRTQLAAQDARAASTAEVASDHVRLFKALGGGWRATELPFLS
ncbi:MAG: efflux transporter outer membrane subunit [Ideonella sp.]|nr:efflux transporter outer membrane subunit [Ideonella sp.]